MTVAVDFEKLGELIDGYGGISADDLSALPVLVDTRDEEIALLKAEIGRLRTALAQVELVLIGLRDGLSVTALSGADGCDDLLGGSGT
jgi:hypothetical protein